MKPESVIKIFKETDALLEGHFILSSGLHSPVYLQCAIALQSPKIADQFAQAIADNFRGDKIEIVAAPANEKPEIGGIGPDCKPKSGLRSDRAVAHKGGCECGATINRHLR